MPPHANARVEAVMARVAQGSESRSRGREERIAWRSASSNAGVDGRGVGVIVAILAAFSDGYAPTMYFVTSIFATFLPCS